MGPRPVFLLLLSLLTAGCSLTTVGLLDLPPDSGDDDAFATGPDASAPEPDRGRDGAALQDSGPDTSTMPPSDAGDPLEASADAEALQGDGSPDALPQTCPQAHATTGTVNVTLYVGGDSNKPWNAVCIDGAAYLPLPNPSGNFSSYPLGGCATAKNGKAGVAGVTTTWSFLRLDGKTLLVDTGNFKGATSVGATFETSGDGSYTHNYVHMPFASARSCDDVDPMTPLGQIDLSNTPFAVASPTWQVQGYSNSNASHQPYGSASPTTGKVIELLVGGFSAGISPCDDYYTTTGGACLQLEYAP